MRSEKSHYTAIKENEKLRLGTLNNPIFYFINNKGNAGLEYEHGKAFVDFLNVSLEVKHLKMTMDYLLRLQTITLILQPPIYSFNINVSKNSKLARLILLHLIYWLTIKAQSAH